MRRPEGHGGVFAHQREHYYYYYYYCCGREAGRRSRQCDQLFDVQLIHFTFEPCITRH